MTKNDIDDVINDLIEKVFEDIPSCETKTNEAILRRGFKKVLNNYLSDIEEDY